MDTEKSFTNMIGHFRISELQTLLAAFDYNQIGRKSELQGRALQLLNNKPSSLNYAAYTAKIVELYRSMFPSSEQQMPHGRKYTRQLQPQKPIATRLVLPPVMSHVQRSTYGNSRGNRFPIKNNQHSNYSADPRNAKPLVPTKQQRNTLTSGNMNDGITFIPSVQSLAKIKFIKLPFYSIVADIIKPTTLIGNFKCVARNSPRGIREAEFKFTLSPENATYITMHREISNGKNEYVYQLQIRICVFQPGSIEITDNLPLELQIRLNNKVCSLPPISDKSKLGTPVRRIFRPIDCTDFVKLNPSISNTITVNWIPDGKTYVLGMCLVKKLTPEKLLEDLYNKKPRSSADTKNDIIQTLDKADPDVSTLSYRFSLICPLGKVKMKIPVKSSKCDHIQCFDASTFILMNEQKPSWTCPTCGQPCLYDDIQIQSYFIEVISSPNLPEKCNEIELLGDGTWKVFEESFEVDNVKKEAIDCITLDDSDDENSVKLKEECKPGNSKKSKTILFFDLTMSDDEETIKENNKQENEEQAVNTLQSETTNDAQPPPQVQEAVTSSEQGEEMDIDNSSPTTDPTPMTTSS